jgi:hypothetical protein
MVNQFGRHKPYREQGPSRDVQVQSVVAEFQFRAIQHGDVGHDAEPEAFVLHQDERRLVLRVGVESAN